MPVQAPVDYLAVAKKQLALQSRAIPQTDRVGIVDFGLPSSRPRFALVDVVKGRVEMFPVTHGRGSDPQHDGWLKRFSNAPGSLASSRGAYRTSDYYWGANGSSMRLAGLEPDNSNADMRAIVIHGADYVSESSIQQLGRLGRSHGCPAVRRDIAVSLINLIRDGAPVYAWHDQLL